MYALVGDMTMTDVQLSRRNSRHLPDPTRCSHKNTYKNTPNNKDSEPCATMEAVYEETDPDAMTDGSTTSSGTVATRHSARLKEKLEKLLQAPSTSTNMEIDEEELRKRARTPSMRVDRSSMPTAAIEFATPEVKKSRNDETLPPHVKAKALFIAQKMAETENTIMTGTSMVVKEQNKAHQVVNGNDGTPKQIASTITASKEQVSTTRASFTKDTTMETRIETAMTKPADEATKEDKPDQETTESAVEHNQALTKGQIAVMAKTDQAQVATNDNAIDQASRELLPEPTAISPKEWWYLHNQWLQSAMRAAMGDMAHPEIPNLANYKYKQRDEPDYEIEVEPPRAYVYHYDLRIKVATRENQVELFHQAFCKWYLKVKEADHQAAIYPWRGQDRDEEALMVENPTDIPMALPLLKKFINKLFLRTVGGNYYVQVLLGTDVDLDTVMQTIRWWLKSTEQGMWKAPLQFAENTVCVRWLLYSADEYKREALCRDIWQLTGIQVALCFWVIDDGKKRDSNDKTKRVPVKALHIEIDQVQQMTVQIEHLFSSKATVFPLGIKMQLVHDYCILTNAQVKAKADSLCSHQERFLAQMETCSTWEISMLDLTDHQTNANLRQFIMNILDPGQPATKLFHAVSKMFSRDRHIFRFHPSRSQHAREVVAGLLVFLKGLWEGLIQTNKFHKFFTDGAIERSRDAWWDATSLCVVMKADQEMENILTFDMDLMFPATKMIINLSGATTPAEMIAKIQDDLLSASSISTFQTTTTKTSRATWKSTKRLQFDPTVKTAMSDTDSVFSTGTFSEKDMSYLLDRLMKAMQVQQKTEAANLSQKKPPGGEVTGREK